MFPSDRVAPLYPQAPDSLFDAFYESQGYGGGILTSLDTGNSYVNILLLFRLFGFVWQTKQFLIQKSSFSHTLA
jgi:hypothetical protein